MNPLDWSGPAFLLLYVPLLMLTFIGAVVLRRRRRLPGGVPTPSDLDLPPIVWSGGEFRLSRRGEAVLWALGRTPSMPAYKDAGL